MCIIAVSMERLVLLCALACAVHAQPFRAVIDDARTVPVAIAVDGQGSTCIAGTTKSPSLPVTEGAFQKRYGDAESVCTISPREPDTECADVFVAKLRPDGSGFEYLTYLGGPGIDNAKAIAIDADGNAYVAGITYSAAFPGTGGAGRRPFAGVQDVFVAKISPRGDALVSATYLGGSSWDFASGVAVDPSGRVFVAGASRSPDFPLSTNDCAETCAYVSTLSPDGGMVLAMRTWDHAGALRRDAGCAAVRLGEADQRGGSLRSVW
jgi:hypothetical protein